MEPRVDCGLRRYMPAVFFTRAAILMILAVSAGVAGTASAGASERPRPGIARNAWEADLVAKAVLERDGSARAGAHVVLWYPKGGLSDEQAAAIVSRLDAGIGAAKRRIGRPDWRVEGDPRVHFYCPPDSFISHAPGGNCAFIPLWRMREDRSPWLHEALHLLLKSDKGDWLVGDDKNADELMPLWLHEGLADALAIDISLAEGLTYYSPLVDVPADQLDALAASTLRAAPSPDVIAAIGGRGKPQGLFGPERVKFAVPFYNGSASFVRYIAQRHGYEPLLAAIDDFGHENETLERETGESLDVMKAAWLTQIKY